MQLKNRAATADEELRMAIAVGINLGVKTATLRNQFADDPSVAARFEDERVAAQANFAHAHNGQWWDSASPDQVGEMLEESLSWYWYDDNAPAAVEAITREVFNQSQIHVGDVGMGYGDGLGFDGWSPLGLVSHQAMLKEVARSVAPSVDEAELNGSQLLARRSFAASDRASDGTDPLDAEEDPLPGRIIEDARIYPALDGYGFMDLNELAGWRAVADWGRDGWDLGHWPETVVMVSDESAKPQAVVYESGAIEVREFDDLQQRNEFLNHTAEWQWRHGVAKGPSDVSAFPAGQLPQHYYGAPAAATTRNEALSEDVYESRDVGIRI